MPNRETRAREFLPTVRAARSIAFPFTMRTARSSLLLGRLANAFSSTFFSAVGLVCRVSFQDVDRKRITAHVFYHFRREGTRIRVMTRTEGKESGLQFHPELFECKGRASEILDSAGFVWFSDYGSIDLLHEEFGLEVCSIHEESDVEPIAKAMRNGFPHWHYSHICHKDCGREPGWKFALHMFPRRCGDGRCMDAD